MINDIDIANKLKLYVVVETSYLKIPVKEFIAQCVSAGVTSFQLRDKEVDTNILIDNAFIFKDVLDTFRDNRPMFIVNDRVDVAHIVGACGVHLGIRDIPISLVKKYFKNLIIGTSCNNLNDVDIANKYAHYAGVGPAFFSNTKKDLRSVLGIDGVKNIVAHLKIPSIAIGGINKDNVSFFNNIGLSGVAISSYICKSNNPYSAIKELLSLHERI